MSRSWKVMRGALAAMLRPSLLSTGLLFACLAAPQITRADEPYGPSGPRPPSGPQPTGQGQANVTPAPEVPLPEPEVPTGDAQEGREGELRLRLLAAQLALLTGRFGEAREAYMAVATEMPNSAAPQEGLGAVARETGRMRLAREYYRAALLIEPENLELARALGVLERDRAPRLRADIEQRFQRGGIGSDRADMTIGEVGGQWSINEAWRIGATQGISYTDATNVRRASGAVTDVTATRIRTEIFATHEWREGQSLTLSLFANEWSGGFGMAGRLPDDWGETALRAEYHRPIWDFVEAIVDGAVRDRVSVARFQRITPDLSLRIEGALNRYGIPRDDDDLVRSATLRGELRLVRVAGIEGLSVSYALDAEYVLSQKTRYDATGAAYQPLPIEDREVHAALIGHGGGIGNIDDKGRLTWQVTAGYGVDRYGLSGPLAFGSLGYAAGPFEGAIRPGYVRNIGRSRGDTTILGATISWAF